MKKVTLIIISILFILSVSACKAEEERQYTYIASDPDFGTQETVAKDFGDFTITFPSLWQDQTAYFSGQMDTRLSEEEVDVEVLYAGMYPSKIDLNSNILIAKNNVGIDLNIDYFDEVYAQGVANEIVEGLDVNVSIDQILYGLLGSKEAAVVYFSYDLYGISVQAIQQIIPSDNGYYYNITYTIAENEGREDIKAIMNSVKFK